MPSTWYNGMNYWIDRFEWSCQDDFGETLIAFPGVDAYEDGHHISNAEVQLAYLRFREISESIVMMVKQATCCIFPAQCGLHAV